MKAEDDKFEHLTFYDPYHQKLSSNMIHRHNKFSNKVNNIICQKFRIKQSENAFSATSKKNYGDIFALSMYR